jgi:CHAD domain-containing protein
MTQLKQARTFGDWGYLALEKHYQKIIDRESAVLQNKDPEQLHQMRVGMRRLRSALSGFDLALDLPPTVKDKEISKIAKVLGQLRDLDVLQETLATQYQPLLPKTEQKILAEVIEILQKQRQKIFKQVKQVLNSDRYLNFKQDIQTWLDEPQYQNIASIAIERVLAVSILWRKVLPDSFIGLAPAQLLISKFPSC